jgi:hypothetical protein
MKRWLLSVLVTLALFAPAMAAEPKIVGPDKVRAGNALILQLVDLPAAQSWEEFGQREEQLSDWRVYPKREEPSFAPPLVVPGRSSAVLVLQSEVPGKYWLVGHVAVAGVDCLVEHEITVTGEGPKPDPQPDPDPKPDPDPDPAPDEIAVVVIGEKDDQTTRHELTLRGLRKYLDSKDVRREIVDDDQVDATTGRPPAFLTRVLASAKTANVPLPLIAVCARDFSRVVIVKPLPKTAAEAIALVKKHGG